MILTALVTKAPTSMKAENAFMKTEQDTQFMKSSMRNTKTIQCIYFNPSQYDMMYRFVNLSSFQSILKFFLVEYDHNSFSIHQWCAIRQFQPSIHSCNPSLKASSGLQCVVVHGLNGCKSTDLSFQDVCKSDIVDD